HAVPRRLAHCPPKKPGRPWRCAGTQISRLSSETPAIIALPGCSQACFRSYKCGSRWRSSEGPTALHEFPQRCQCQDLVRDLCCWLPAREVAVEKGCVRFPGGKGGGSHNIE